MRRLVPTIAVLGVGLLLLLWGLATLEGIVLDERRDAQTAVQGARQTLAEYARRAVQAELAAALHAVEPELDEAASNPLVSAERILLLDDGHQVLPRATGFAAGPGTPAKELYTALRTGDVDDVVGSLGDDPEAPWARRIELQEAAGTALRAGDNDTIATSVRQILRHRARWVLPSADDIPATVALIDDLYQFAAPDDDLMRMLLRDGFDGGGQQRRDGLQPQLLSRRDQFTESDFRFLAERIVANSQRAAVEVADFEARVRAPVAATVPVPANIDEATLVDDGHWYVEPRPPAWVVGIRLDVAQVVHAVQRQMFERALLTEDDTLTLPPLADATRLSELALQVSAPRLDASATTADRRFWLKTTFVGLAGFLALVIAVLAVVLQHKGSRFVELKSDFVATVSHELRTPLASIRLMAETLERRTAGIPRVKDYPTRIVREIDELAFLVDNILSFNRLDKGRWEPRLSQVSIAELVSDVVESLEHYGFGTVALTTEGIDELLVQGDRELIKLLLRNLAKNACTYNERTPIALTVTGERTGGRVRIDFSDNGIGIPPEEQRRVFEDFRRGGRSRARGSGLGLSICRKSVQAHGGRITIASSSDQGTTFRIDLPAADSPTPQP